MYKGKRTEGQEFYKLLFENVEFNSELGRVVLAAGRLESELILFFHRNEVESNFNNATLGRLIKVGKENNLYDNNLFRALDTIRIQRNYLMHNIHALLTNSIEETILEGRDLLDSDVHTYIERAWQLKENINHLAEVISEK